MAPFENRTGDASLALLGDMAADWITQGQIGEAGENYLRAFRLDTTFYQALLSASYAALMQGPRALRFLQPILERLRERLSPDQLRALEFQRAYRDWNCHGMYALTRAGSRGHPASENTRFGFAVAAGRVHRYRESLAEMRRMHPDLALTPKWYWAYLGGAQHMFGDYRGQLRAAAEMARRSPQSVAGVEPAAPVVAGHARGAAGRPRPRPGAQP